MQPVREETKGRSIGDADGNSRGEVSGQLDVELSVLPVAVRTREPGSAFEQTGVLGR